MAAVGDDRPGHPVSRVEALSLRIFPGAPRSLVDDFSDNFMPEDRRHRALSTSLETVQVTAAEGAAQDADQCFTRRGNRQRQFAQNHLAVVPLEQCDAGLGLHAAVNVLETDLRDPWRETNLPDCRRHTAEAATVIQPAQRSVPITSGEVAPAFLSSMQTT